jgi:hypothetical protein
MKKALLEKIELEESKLNDQDVEGHVWWNRFRQLVEETPEVSEQPITKIDVGKFTYDSDHYKFEKKK